MAKSKRISIARRLLRERPPSTVTRLPIHFGIKSLGEIADQEELLSFARRDGLRCGGLPIKDGFQLAMPGGFLRGEDRVALTDLGLLALARCTEDEPSSEVLRLFISVLLLRHPPAWVAYWQGDPSSLDIVLPETSRELLDEAKVLAIPGTEDLEAWALWDALKATPPLELLAEHRKAIGDAAETLSFNYEKERLIREGHPTLAARVRWLARESPAYGFDILSFCGSLRKTAPDRPLAIEVKGQAVAGLKQFTFFLTSHEWGTASALGEQYLLHLWDGVRPGAVPSARCAEPLLVQPDSLRKHIPSRPGCGDACDWSSALIRLDVHVEAIPRPHV
jgi:hypothetical protein